MIRILCRSGNLANVLKTTNSVAASNIGPQAPAVPDEQPKHSAILPVHATSYTSACAIPSRKMVAVSGPTAKSSVRFGHTDVKVPDFTADRRNSSKNPNQSSRDSQDTQRLYGSMFMALGGAAAFYGAKATVRFFLSSMLPSSAVMALAQIEVNKSDIPEGKNVAFKWRGKPLFVRHRTAEEIKTEAAVNVASLRDPQHDNERTKDPKWLIVIGVCTHLGCVPISHQGDWGGYYCPCHGSHYDASGRIRKGPAPLNLEVPPYEIKGDVIVVG